MEAVRGPGRVVAGGPPLLERTAELDVLSAGLEAARAGLGRAVLIEGSAGVGKTRLLEVAREAASVGGVRVLKARGDELEAGFAWGVARQLLEPPLAAAGPAERGRLLSGAAALAASLLGAHTAGGAAGEPEDAFTLIHGLYWLTAGLAERHPLVMTVDDAHLADAPSLRYLAYLVRRVDDLPLVLVVAVRSGEPGVAPELLEAIRRQEAVRRLEPKPLSATAVTQLIEGLLGCAPDLEFSKACHAVTGGNPFLLGELLRTLKAEGMQPVAAAAARVGSLVPQKVSSAVLARLARLPPQAASLARAVALLGRDAELRHAAALAELGERAAAEAADALVAAGILCPGRPLEFLHPLVRSAVYEDLPPAQRALGHAGAARLLAGEGAGVERVAAHLLAAEPAGDRWVVDVLRAAVRRAVGRGASESAVAYLRRALQEPAARGERGGLLLELGRLEGEIGAAGAEEHLAEARAELSDTAKRAQAALELARVTAVRTPIVEVVALLSEAVEELGQSEPELRLTLQTDLVMAARLEPATRALAAQHRAELQRAAAHADTRAARHALATLAQQAVFEHRSVADAADLARRALAGGSVDPNIQASWSCAVDALIAAGRYETAEAVCGQAIEAARRCGSVVGFVTASTESAFLALHRGKLREAEMHARAAVDAEVGDLRYGLLAVGLLAWVAAETGGLQPAEELLEWAGLGGEIEADTTGGLLSVWQSLVMVWRGQLRLAQARTDEAIRDRRRGGELLVAHRIDTPVLFPWRHLLAAALAARGQADQLRALVQHDLALARATGSPRATGIALHAAGLLQGGEDGLVLLREAVAMLEGSGAQLEDSRALVDLGSALRRANRRREARELLSLGLERAHRCGAAPLAQQARNELAVLGARPRQPVLRTRGPHSHPASGSPHGR